MKFRDKLFNNTIWGEKTEITPEMVEYYKKNPDELELIIDKEYFYGKFIRFFFILGVVITISSRVLKFLFEDTWAAFVNDVILDVFSELGIAIFGGAITTFLLEKLNQRQYEQNLSFRREILERIKQAEKP